MFSQSKSFIRLTGIAAALLLTVYAQAADIAVPSADYPTIQSAITAATVGDTIHIAAGTYRERLQWNNKDLTIRGAGATTTLVDVSIANGGPGGACLTTNGLTPAARLEGVTLRAGRTSPIMTRIRMSGSFPPSAAA